MYRSLCEMSPYDHIIDIVFYHFRDLGLLEVPTLESKISCHLPGSASGLLDGFLFVDNG